MVGQRGQALIEFALIFPLMLMLLGFAVDCGFWMFEITKAQGAANSAAMAGAHQLPDTIAAEVTAIDYAGRHGFTPAEVATTTTATDIEVIISRPATLFFTKIFMEEGPILKGFAVYGTE